MISRARSSTLEPPGIVVYTYLLEKSDLRLADNRS